MSRRLIMSYCASGPYRHAADVLSRDPFAWLPWGYDKQRIADDVPLSRATDFELWEVDDIRKPHAARCVTAGTIDFVQTKGEYVALTLRCFPGSIVGSEEQILAEIAQGRLVFLSSPVATGAYEPVAAEAVRA